MSMRAQLKAQLTGSSRRRQSGTAKGRAQSEQDALANKDDRRFTHRGETKQLNTAVQVHWKQWINEASREHGKEIYELVEHALALLKAELEGGGHA